MSPSRGSPDPRPGTRRYLVRGRIGQGGFGAVYRATLQGDHGFAREVAVKLLHDQVADPDTLARFRDEARILGLVRDRGVVAVEPPTRLEGRWALVMDYVDGISLSRLLTRVGPLPPRVAAEITAEVARVLHAVHHQQGPDGKPLALLHRDLKPANLQITPSGIVKLLDFGIAKGTFDAREAHTTRQIVGTFAYMAPERVLQRDGPEADVYSLGAVLRRMLFGDRPVSPGLIEENGRPAGPPALLELAALGERMTRHDPAERPTAREVEDVCGALARRLGGPRLLDWCEIHVPADLPLEDDPLAGTWLTEASPTTPVVTGWRLPLAALSTVLLGVLLAAGLGIGAAVAVVALDRPTPTVPVPAGPPPPVPRASPPAPEPIPPEPLGPVPSVAPSRPVPAAPPVVPTRPGPEPSIAQRHAVTFGSVPPGAEVIVDGESIGHTPIVGHLLEEGSHTVTLRHADREMLRTITVGDRRPSRYIWTHEGWRSFL